MNENKLHELLIDYVEGNISSDQKIEIESLIQKSPLMQNELDVIQSALTELLNTSDEDVPEHYFTNFLPRLRKRLESGKIHLPLFIPEWFRLASSSLAVTVIVFSIVLLYQSFKPEELRSPIYSMVNDMERTEINSVIDETTNFESSTGIIQSAENLVNNISNVSVIESKLTEELLVLDVSSYQTEHELLSDMGDKEIEQMLDRLDKQRLQ
jgi:hypothetical protein